jgi:hypothetical protein
VCTTQERIRQAKAAERRRQEAIEQENKLERERRCVCVRVRVCVRACVCKAIGEENRVERKR